MSLQNRPLSSNLRHTSFGGAQASSGQSPVLLARINEKKNELESLKQLRDLSGGLAAQMQALEDKLSTLSDGTEAVAAVLSNWHNVMQAINMASGESRGRSEKLELTTLAAKLPKPAAPADEGEATKKIESEVLLPQTLVRIPVDPEEQARKPQMDAEKEV